MDRVPVATYRIQLRQGFGFDQVAALVPYWAELGISHVYLSPCFRAAPDSTHGYDVTDPNRVDEALGGEPARQRFLDALSRHGLGHIVDLVPNHMSVASDENLWWWDVLSKGPSSPHAPCFDVEWEGPTEEASSKVLLPILGDHYGRVLEARQISLVREHSGITLAILGRRLPLSLESLAPLYASVAETVSSDELEFLASALRWASAEKDGARRVRYQSVIQNRLTDLFANDSALASEMDRRIDRLNMDNEALDELIARQYYRVAHYKIARYDLDYRRFFDIHDLAALNVHDPAVFQKTHALILKWIREGEVDGVRIDHPDGLRDPSGYFQRLQSQREGLWVVAEKILQPGERLPEDWAVHGTTGYDFLNELGGLFVRMESEARLTEVYREFLRSPEAPDFRGEERAAKRFILDDLLGSELRRLTRLFQRICASKRRHRDFAREELRRALREVIACFPVYRTYIRPGSAPQPAEIEYVKSAVRAAAEARADLDLELLAFLEELLRGQCLSELEWGFVARFQQLTAAAMAKGLEDTAFYRYHRLVALNEVGGDPGRFGTAPERFHEFCMALHSRWPLSMVTTATHDTKRSQDARLRVAALTEFAEEWAQAVQGWSDRAGRYASAGFPDRATEYLIWQSMVAAYPISEERLSRYVEKAVREAKLYTSWLASNPEYETAVMGFVGGVLSDTQIQSSVGEFVERLLPVAWRSSLSETLIQLTACGVPDIYQGGELWETHLTDPDNRLHPDFAERRRLLEISRSASAEEAMAGLAQGLPKLWMIQRVLRFRKRHPELFGPDAEHIPLQARGSQAERVVAYGRGARVVVVAPRLWAGVLEQGWGDTRLDLPPLRFLNIFDRNASHTGSVEVAELLRRFPVALLTAEEEA